MVAAWTNTKTHEQMTRVLYASRTCEQLDLRGATDLSASVSVFREGVLLELAGHSLGF